MVYTPIKSVVTGGHFYLYDTMHLTELACAYDNSTSPDGSCREDHATNASHPDMTRFVARMMLALPYISKQRSEFHVG